MILPSGIIAPGRATTTLIPSATLGDPHTIWTVLSSAIRVCVTFKWSDLGWSVIFST